MATNPANIPADLTAALAAVNVLGADADAALALTVSQAATIAGQAATIAQLQAELNPPPPPTATPFTFGYPFPSAVFAKPLPASPVLVAGSATLIANMVAEFPSEYGGVGCNRSPIRRVPVTQPAVPLSMASGGNNFLPDTGPTIQLPLGAPVGAATDYPDCCWVQGASPADSDTETWVTTATATGYTAKWGGKLTNLAASPGVFPAPYGDSASGISYLATLVSQNDMLRYLAAVAAGNPNADFGHVIAFQTGIVNSNIVPPADRTDGGNNPGYICYGDVIFLPRSLAMPSGMAPFAQGVFRTLQNWGAVAVDQTRESGNYMVAEDASEWARQGQTGTDPITTAFAGKPEYSVLSAIPWPQLQVTTI